MAKTSVVVDFRVNGQNELASAIKQVGAAINSINFDKLGEATALAGILSSFGQSKFTFDVTTGSGVKSAIDTLRQLLAEFNKVENIRNAMMKQGRAPVTYFESVAQTATNIPEGMTVNKIHGMLSKIGKIKKEDGITSEQIENLEELARTLKEAQNFLKEAGDTGAFLGEEVKKYVDIFLNFEPAIRKALDEGRAKYAGITGKVGDTISEIFRNLSQRVRDEAIIATQEQLKIKKEDLRAAKAAERAVNKDKSATEYQIQAAAKAVSYLEIEVRDLQQSVTDLTNANKVLKREESEVRSSQGALKNVQSAKVKAEVLANADDLGKLFKDILFINNKASAKQIADAINRREKDLIDYLSSNTVYGMSPDEQKKHWATVLSKTQDILKYRELAMMKEVAMPEKQFKALQRDQKIYQVPQNLTEQKIDELESRLNNASNVTEEMLQLIELLEQFRKIAKVVTPRQKVPITDQDSQNLADYMLLWRDVQNKINQALKKARNQIIAEATSPLWTPEQYIEQRKSNIAQYKQSTQQERDDLLIKFKAEKDSISKRLNEVRKNIHGLNTEEEKQAIQTLKYLSAQLNLRKLLIDAIQQANAEIKKEPKQKEQKPEEVEKKVDKEIKKKEAEQQKELNKQQKEQLMHDEKIAAIEEKILISQGARYNLKQVLLAMEARLLEIKSLDAEMESNALIVEQQKRADAEGRTLAEQQLLEIQQERDILFERQFQTEEELTEWEKEKINNKLMALDAEERWINENGAKEVTRTKEEIEEERKLAKIQYARLQTIEKLNQSHKTSIGKIISEYLSLDKIVARMSFVWTAMFSYGLANQIKSIFNEAIQQAIELEKIVARLNSIMSTYERTFAENMKNTIIEISKQTGIAFKEIGEAMYEVQSSNFNPEMTQEITKQAAKMAIANNASIASSTNMLISVLNTYKGELVDVQQVSDKLFKLIEFGRTDLDKLNNNFSTLANTAAILGVSFDDIITALSIMTNQGVNTDQAIISLNRLLMQFADGGSAEAQKAAKRVGVELNTQEIRTNGLISVIEKLSNATDTEIVALSGNVRAFKAAASIVKDQSKYMEFYEQILNSTGSTQRAYNEVSETTAFLMQQQKQELIAGFLVLAQNVLPALVTAKRLIADIGKALGLVNPHFIGLSVVGLLVARAMKAMIATFKTTRAELLATQPRIVGVQIGLKTMSASAVAGKAAVMSLKAALASLAPTLIVLALSAVISHFIKLREEAKEAKLELERLTVTDKELGARAKESAAEQLKRIELLRANMKMLERYANVVRDTTESDIARNTALEAYNNITGALLQEAPELYSFLDNTGKSVNNLANQWINVANGLATASAELEVWQKIVEAESGINVGVESKKQSELELERLLSDKQAAKDRIATAGWSKKSFSPSKSQINDIIAYIDSEVAKGVSAADVASSASKQFGGGVMEFPYLDALLFKVAWDKEALQAYAEIVGKQSKLESNIETADKFLTQNMTALQTLRVLYGEEYNRYKHFPFSGLPSGKREEGGDKGSTPSYTVPWEELKKKWDLRLDYFHRNYDEFAGQIEEAITEERGLEQLLLDKFIAIRDNPKYELDATEQEKFTMDFINWYWNWKKDKFGKIIKILREKMNKLDDVQGQREIKAQIDLLTEEVLLGASQMMDFNIDTTQFKEVSNLRFDPTTDMVYNVKVIDKWARENLPDALDILKQLTPLATKQLNDVRLALEYYRNEQVTAAELIEKGFDSEYVEQIDFKDLKGYLANAAKINETSAQELEDSFGMLERVLLESPMEVPQEVLTALNAMAGGRWIGDLEWMVSLLSGIDVDLDKWLKELKDNIRGYKFNTVKEFIDKMTEDVSYLGSHKTWDELTAEDVEKLLLIPSLNEDVVKALTDRMNEFERNIDAFDLETERLLNDIREKRNKNKKYITDLFSGEEKLNFSGIWSLTKLFAMGDQDDSAELRIKEIQRLKQKLKDESDSLTESQKVEIESKILELDQEQAMKYVDNIKNLVSSLKETWEMYYQWQMDKIQEWYDGQSKIIDNKAKYEYRSALWTEKQKEKLDKEREAKEKKFAYMRKAMAISEAVIDTAVAVMNMHAGFRPPLNFIMAGIVAAIGAAQVALISQQKFAQGGYIYGPSHKRGGVHIEAEGGEYIINKNATKKYLPIIEQINQAGLDGTYNKSVAPFFQSGGFVDSSREVVKSEQISNGLVASIVNAIKSIDVQVQVNSKTLTEIEIWKKTVKGQRLAKVM